MLSSTTDLFDAPIGTFGYIRVPTLTKAKPLLFDWKIKIWDNDDDDDDAGEHEYDNDDDDDDDDDGDDVGDDDDDDDGYDDDDGIITERKAHCMLQLQTSIASGISCKHAQVTRREKHIAGFQSQLASMNWVLTLGTCQKRERLEHVVL